MKLTQLICRHQALLSILIFLTVAACASTGNKKMGQAAIKNFETRSINASQDVVFTAATEALFDLGYIITHSDNDSGIIVGEMQDQRNDDRAVMTILFGYAAGASVRPRVYNCTLLVKPMEEDCTNVRIKTSVDGEPKLDKRAIDQIWLYIDRQVLMETPPQTAN